MKISFTNFLRDLARRDDPFGYGDFSRFVLARSDTRLYVADEYSYARLSNETSGSYPIWSNDAQTIFAWVRAHMPDEIELYHRIADEYRAIRGNSRWPDLREPEKPTNKPVPIDFEALKRESRRKYLYGTDDNKIKQKEFE